MILDNYCKSNKILGLEYLKDKGLNVPEFSFIPDFEDLNINFSALNYKYKIKPIQEIIEIALTEVGESRTGYSLRSASFDEDNTDKSAAGRYLSFNGLLNIEQIYNAATTIWRNHRSLTSSGIACPLIIQKTHSSYFSGVLFKDTDNNKTVIIESYYGSCRTIVNGMGLPYRTYYVDNDLHHEFQPGKNFCHRFFAHANLFSNQQTELLVGSLLKPEMPVFPGQPRLYLNPYRIEYEIYAYRLSSPPEWYLQKTCKELIDAAFVLDKGKGVDIEWGTDIDGKLWFYQFRELSRPLVAIKKPDEIEIRSERATRKVYRGLPGAPGRVEGIISKDLSQKNNILMLSQASVQDVRLIENSAGVISAMGGMLSHIAIVCRELNKPCVLGIHEMIPDSTKVEIDGSTGIVRVID